MRWSTPLALALALAASLTACRQTVVLDLGDGGSGLGGLGGGFGGFGGGGGFAFDGGVPDCTGQPITLVAELPDLIVVLDRSTGMDNDHFGSSNNSALSAARDTLDFIASKYQKVVRFGYVEFPGSSQSCSSQTGCCASTPSLPNSNYQAFEYALHACDQGTPYCVVGDQRPTTAALSAAASSFSRSGNNHTLFLITNGQPDCGTGPNTPCMDATAIVSQQWNQFSVSTHVIVPEAGQLDDPTKACLTAIAAQGGPIPNLQPFYHLASTAAQLTDTVNQLTLKVANYACHLDMQTPSPMQIKPDSVLVWYGNGNNMPVVVPTDRTNGWDVSGNGYTIDLNGSWCDMLIMGDPHDFKLMTGCDQHPH